MHCSSLLAALLVPVMVSIVSAEEASPVPQEFDVIIRNGTVYDGSGGEGRQADVALRGDRIAGVGNFKSATAKVTIDARRSFMNTFTRSPSLAINRDAITSSYDTDSSPACALRYEITASTVRPGTKVAPTQ